MIFLNTVIYAIQRIKKLSLSIVIENIVVKIWQTTQPWTTLDAESFISGLKKRGRDEATPIPSIYDKE